MTSQAFQHEPITAGKVPESKRANLLYLAFGKACVRFERLVYLFADQLCSEYTGGFWEFYLLSNGAFYMTPPDDMEVSAANGFTGRMSADAVGIVVSLYAASALAEQSDRGIDAFHRLREFALDHPESSAIFRAID
jgi:hypothetical protein